MTLSTDRLHVSLRAEPSSVRVAREAVARVAFGLGVSRDVVDDMRLCVSEAVANAVRHAYPDPAGEIQISCDPFGRGALVVVRDFGLGTAPARAREGNGGGGFGWRIIESLADRFSVKSSPEDGTEVWMSFGTSTGEAKRRRSPGRTHTHAPARSDSGE